MRIAILVLTLAAVLWGCAGQQADQPPLRKLSDVLGEEGMNQMRRLVQADQKANVYIRSDAEYRRNAEAKAMVSAERTFRECDDFTVVSHRADKLDGDLAFGPDGEPRSVSWIDHVDITGCGQSMLHNVYFAVENGGEPRYGLLIPGETKASARLQRDATRLVALHARRDGLGECGQASTLRIHTELAEPVELKPAPELGPNQIAAHWTERWVVEGCGRTQAYRLSFVETNMGTAFDVERDG